MPIEQLEILVDNPNFPSWIANIEAFQHRNVFKFTNGLNLIIGRNMSGKSTLLKMLSEPEYASFVRVIMNGTLKKCFFDLHQRMDVSTFSYGELQSHQFINTMNGGSEIILLDEPDRGLDPSFQQSMIRTILHKIEANIQILLTTNSPYVYSMLRKKATTIIEMTDKYQQQLNAIIDDILFLTNSAEGIIL